MNKPDNVDNNPLNSKSDQDETSTLASLWQNQRTHSFEVDELIGVAKSQQKKQRFYMVLDVMSLLPFLLLFFIDLPSSPYFTVFMFMIFVLGLVMVAYFIRLRWFAAFGDLNNASDYANKLMKQYKNNARVAQINKHSGYLAVLLAAVSALILGIVDAKPLDELLKSIALVSVLMIALMIPWCIWAHRRQKHFEAKHHQMKRLLAEP